MIAELQVLGVKANYMKRPYDSTTSFAVHGVHLVDAIQSFGPDYELLFSSCKPHLAKYSSDTNFTSPRSKLQSVLGWLYLICSTNPISLCSISQVCNLVKTKAGNNLNQFQFYSINLTTIYALCSSLVYVKLMIL